VIQDSVVRGSHGRRTVCLALHARTPPVVSGA
jgi:hypothetical protein